MMAGNPSWWSMHPPSHQQPSALLSTSQSLFPSPYVLGSSSLPLNSLPDNQEHPQSWSQLLLGGGLSGDEDRFSASHFQPKKFENWDEQIINPSPRVPVVDHVKQEVPQTNNLYIPGSREFQAASWPQIIPCNSTAPGGGACKKARVQPSSSGQPPLKVRKEKLGDRITTLHQLVSPFGKTDTASVLLEAIGYIRFLQGQIEALSSPYLNTSSANMRNQQCDDQDKPKDLRSRGLCLVPVSCTLQVESENGADYWAPALGGGGF